MTFEQRPESKENASHENHKKSHDDLMKMFAKIFQAKDTASVKVQTGQSLTGSKNYQKANGLEREGDRTGRR